MLAETLPPGATGAAQGHSHQPLDEEVADVREHREDAAARTTEVLVQGAGPRESSLDRDELSSRISLTRQEEEVVMFLPPSRSTNE